MQSAARRPQPGKGSAAERMLTMRYCIFSEQDFPKHQQNMAAASPWQK